MHYPTAAADPPPDEVDSVITDERMIFSVSETQTTLYDEINFSGSPSSFAWVLPIKGNATVGLSADILFASLDQLTATQVVAPPLNCPPAPTCGSSGAGCGSASTSISLAAAGFSDGEEGPAAAAPVSVTAQVQVGPYETVQLQSTDPKALDNWLTSHGYAVAASEAPVIAAYIAEGFGFLAMKLVPGQGVSAMRPVRVTTPGAGVTLPLRMVGVGTGATTGSPCGSSATGAGSLRASRRSASPTRSSPGVGRPSRATTRPSASSTKRHSRGPAGRSRARSR